MTFMDKYFSIVQVFYTNENRLIKKNRVVNASVAIVTSALNSPCKLNRKWQNCYLTQKYKDWEQCRITLGNSP